MALGNTYSKKTVSFGAAKRVWREIRHRFPSGGTISNASDFAEAKIIKAGTPVKFDETTYAITAYTDTAIKSAENVGTLGINGLLQNDVYLGDGIEVATGTVVYSGEIYAYMLDSQVVDKIDDLITLAEIKFVN